MANFVVTNLEKLIRLAEEKNMDFSLHRIKFPQEIWGVRWGSATIANDPDVDVCCTKALEFLYSDNRLPGIGKLLKEE